MKRDVGNVSIEVTRGDIVEQPDVDAVVNAANARLQIGGGVAGAIHRAAGPGLARETKDLAPIEPGQAVITSGHDLPNPHVIHCLGPVYGRDEPPDELLAMCYENALDIAEAEGLKSIAFPAISTGAFGYPLSAAARVSVDAVIGKAHELQHVGLVRFVLYAEADLGAFERALEDALDDAAS